MATILRPTFGDVRVRRREPMDNDFFDRRFKLLVDAITSIITELETVTAAGDSLVQLGLTRINEVLTPALVKVNSAAELGFLIGISTTSLTIEAGQNYTFEINEATRGLFTPTPFLTITRSTEGAEDEYAVGRLVAWNNDNGGLSVDILVTENLTAGAHGDWVIAASAGIAPGVIARAIQVAADAIQVAADRLYVEGVVADIQEGPVISVAGKTGAVSLVMGDVAGLVTALAGKTDTSHSHAQSDITGLVTALAAKAALSHTHAQGDITNLATDLAAKVSKAAPQISGPMDAADQEVSKAKFKDYAITVNALGNSTGAKAINMELGNFVSATATGAVQWSVQNPPATGIMGSFVLALTNGGNYAQTWMSGIKWPAGTAPTLTSNGLDLLAFHTVDAGATWRGALIAKDVK